MCGECRPLDDAADATLADRIAAEHARFDTTVDHAVVEVGAAERLLGGRDRHDFGMSRHVGVMFHTVYGLSHHLASPTLSVCCFTVSDTGRVENAEIISTFCVLE